MHLDASWALLPDPEKVHKGGEDALFVGKLSFGVFDGVGGWAREGIDSGIFSRQLAQKTEEAINSGMKTKGEDGRNFPDLVAALSKALASVDEMGSCTACIVHVSANGQYSALNVGDSGFRVLRPSESQDGPLSVVVSSRQQQHFFNCPLQLGTGSKDLPEHGDRYEGEMQAGDLLLLATDGCFDNLFDEEIAEMMARPLSEGQSASFLANMVCTASRTASLQKKRRTPFAVSAREHGFQFQGGKVDDVAVVAVRVLASDEPLAEEKACEAEQTELPRSKL